MNSDHTNEQSVELMDIAANETISAPPIIRETEDKCESSDFTVVAVTVTAENKADCEKEDVQLVTESHLSPVAEPDPASPLSMHSVTDSQFNIIPLSLEDLPISEASCDLEDATELVCGLTRNIAYMKQAMICRVRY